MYLKIITIFILYFVNFVDAHSWLDILSTDFNVASANGYNNDWVYRAAYTKGIGSYVMNYATRDQFNVNEVNTHEILDKYLNNPNTQLCKDQYRSSYNKFGGPEWRNLGWFRSGETIYFGYTENGHLSKTYEGVGTNIEIYWEPTGNPINKVGQINSNNLVGISPFESILTPKCGETRNSASIRNGRTGRSCVGSFKVPNVKKNGFYSFIWVWNGLEQSWFHNCFDIHISNNNNDNSNSSKPDILPSSQQSGCKNKKYKLN